MTGWWLAHWTEVVGFVTGAACVLLAARRIIWTYPLGIANNVVFAGLFVEHALYADAGLQVVYLILGVAGWIGWAHRPAVDHRVAIVGLPRRTIPILIMAAIVGTVVIALILHLYTDSTTEVADAATTTVSLVAQVMMNQRWLESWFVWIAVDVGYVALYLSKGLLITALLYLIFIGFCLLGFRTWRQAPPPISERTPAPAAVRE